MIMLTLFFLSEQVITVQEYLIHYRFKDSQIMAQMMVARKHHVERIFKDFSKISQMISPKKKLLILSDAMSHFIKSEVARLVLSYLHEYKLGRDIRSTRNCRSSWGYWQKSVKKDDVFAISEYYSSISRKHIPVISAGMPIHTGENSDKIYIFLPEQHLL